MKATVTIVENATGDTVQHVDEWRAKQSASDTETPAYYLIASWRDGNNSCDCNRELLFRRAKGWTEEKIWENETGFCIGTGRYSVPFLVLETGERVEIDGAR